MIHSSTGSHLYIAKSLSNVRLPLASSYAPAVSKADRLHGSYVVFVLSNHLVRPSLLFITPLNHFNSSGLPLIDSILRL